MDNPDDDSSVWMPPANTWLVKAARFINVLDDQHNILSPTKINVWAANLGAVCAAVGTGVAWVAGHLTGIESVWAGTLGWITHAHIVHQANKKQGNKLKVDMAKLDKESPNGG